MRGKIDAVLFDAGGVLVLPDPTVLGPLLAYYGGSPDHDVHARAHYAGMAAKSASTAGENDWTHYDEVYLETVGVKTNVREEALDVFGRVKGVANLWRHPTTQAKAVLQTLHDKGVPIGIVSNASGQIEDTLRQSSICQVGEGPLAPVRFVIDSHIVGIQKPDPRIFHIALEMLPDIDPSRIAYVGDSLIMDVQGSRNVGLVPVLVDPYGFAEGHDVHRIASLDEVVHFFSEN
jgi:putative hydrolase of the HAD superfamily